MSADDFDEGERVTTDARVSRGSPWDDLMDPLRHRWSPREFDAEYHLTGHEVDVLLEAARWAPSAGNSQPWSFHAAMRGSDGHAALVAHLAGSSAAWAPSAALLVVNLSHTRVEDTEWEYSEFSQYDLGQAVAHMTIQAQSMGLACRQFRAFDRERVLGRSRSAGRGASPHVKCMHGRSADP